MDATTIFQMDTESSKARTNDLTNAESSSVLPCTTTTAATSVTNTNATTDDKEQLLKQEKETTNPIPSTVKANTIPNNNTTTTPTTNTTTSSKGNTCNSRERKKVQQFLSQYKCYDLIPVSNKMIIFDKKLQVKKAFFALLQNGIRSAPVWDCEIQKFIGMVTITDFINILRMYYRDPDTRMDELEDHKIQTWREIMNLPSSLHQTTPNENLLNALKLLLSKKIHRLPIIDAETNNALFVMTLKRILNFIHQNLNTDGMRFMDMSIKELKIGTYTDIFTVTYDMPLNEILNLFAAKRVSALPVVNEKGVVVDVYAKFDVMNLARERAYNNLDIPIKVAMEKKTVEYTQGLQTCSRNDSLRSVIQQIAKAKVHRLIVVDENKYVDGIVSLSDVLTYILID